MGELPFHHNFKIFTIQRSHCYCHTMDDAQVQCKEYCELIICPLEPMFVSWEPLKQSGHFPLKFFFLFHDSLSHCGWLGQNSV